MASFLLLGDIPCSLWDLSSPTSDQTHAPIMEMWGLNLQGSLWLLFLMTCSYQCGSLLNLIELFPFSPLSGNSSVSWEAACPEHIEFTPFELLSIFLSTDCPLFCLYVWRDMCFMFCSWDRFFRNYVGLCTDFYSTAGSLWYPKPAGRSPHPISLVPLPAQCPTPVIWLSCHLRTMPLTTGSLQSSVTLPETPIDPHLSSCLTLQLSARGRLWGWCVFVGWDWKEGSCFVIHCALHALFQMKPSKA